MEKLFDEVFPTLELPDKTKNYLTMTSVERVTRTSKGEFLRIYLCSDHLIPKAEIRALEREIQEQIVRNTETTVVVYERFALSNQYTLESLLELYLDSILEELQAYSYRTFNMLRTAKLSFPAAAELLVTAEDRFLYREREEDLVRILEKILCERCGLEASVRVEYCAPPESGYEKEDSLRMQMRVQEISRRAGRHFDGDAVFLGSTQSGGGDLAGGGSGAGTGTGGNASGKAERTEQTRADSGSARNGGTTRAGQTAGAGAGAERHFSGAGGRGGKAYGQRRSSGELRRSDNPDVLYGREVNENAVPIEEIVGEVGEVVIRGRILKLETRDIKNEKTIVTFQLTDGTDTIKVKLFVPTEKVPELTKELKEKAAVKVKGVAAMDAFDKELGIGSVVSIQKIPAFEETRMDLAPRKRVELHFHTKMSEMDATIDPAEAVKRAYSWGHRAIALTDHGVVHGFTDANHAWEELWKAESARRKENGDEHPDRQDFFKILYGVECYLVDDLRRVVTNDAGQDFDGDFVVFDIETTGLSPVRNRIIEFGAVKVSGGRITDRFASFVNPQIPIPFETTRLTSIRDADVADAGTIAEVLPEFLRFCEGAVLVAHNAEFDVNFVKEKCRELGSPQEFTYVDTLPLARVQYPGHSKYGLSEVCKLLGVVNEHHHRAVDDAEATAKIFVKLLEQLKNEGMTHLSEINEKEKRTPEAIAKLRANHAVLIAKNELGRVHLYKLISDSHLKYFNRFPKIPKSLIEKCRDGLIVGSACEAGELYEALVEGRTDEQIARIVSFYDYLEIQPVGNNAFMVDAKRHTKLETGGVLEEKRYPNINSLDDIREMNRRVVELGKTFHKPVVATCDVHFLEERDSIYRAILMNGKKMEDADNQPPLFFRTTDEMLEEFAYLGSEKAFEIVVKNTNLIADMCETISPVRPDKCPPVIPDSDVKLREICYRRAREIYGDDLPEIVTERLERELGSIISNGFAVMYIIAQKLVWKSVEDGYLVGSRGSVGSSFVATMAGITEINPLSPHYYCSECHYTDFSSDEVKAYAGKAGVDMPDKVCPRCGAPLHKDGFDIPFETFLGFKGDKEPDIDLNFSGEYQSKAHKYTEVIFGSGQTFRAGTIGTLADKTAYGYVRMYYEEHGEHKRKAEMERQAVGCTGVRRSTGQHPGGIIVLPLGQDINSFTPVQHPANKETDIITTHFDYHSIDHNLLKLDILGHDDPTMIRMLQDLTGIDPLTIPLDGPEVMSLFQNTEALGITPDDIGGTKLGALGIPEFGTDFAMQMLIDTQPKAFSDLVRIAGLAHGTDVWLGNAQTLIKEGKATISTAICTRDDIMTYLIGKGVESEESFKIMEAVRKGVIAKAKDKGKFDGKAEKWPKWRADMESCGVPDWYIWSCERIRYMFPKAHAAAYVMMAWRIAYCKIHHPEAYYAAWFSIRAKQFSYAKMCQGREHAMALLEELKSRKLAKDRKEPGAEFSDTDANQLYDLRLVQEMYARGIEFTPIDIYKVKARSFQIVDGKLMPSLLSIDNLGEAVADAIEYEAARAPFVSRDDFRTRCKVSQTICDDMNELGLLGGLPESDQISLFDLM